jgi:hypothetical protein
MHTHSQHLTVVRFSSEVLPEVNTEDPELAKTIAWADANPVVWKIVTGTRSRAFGRGSSEYIGWAQRSMAPEATLERARHFHTCIDANVRPGLEYRSRDIWGWRARFTFQQFTDRRFRGGFFLRFDGRYDRECMTLDYTPETLPQVVRNFMDWAHVDLSPSSREVVKLHRETLPESIMAEARRLRCTIWDPPGTVLTNGGPAQTIRPSPSEPGGQVAGSRAFPRGA